MTVSYSINGKSIQPEELKEVQITKKDYIDYVEAIKQSASNSYRKASAPLAERTQGIG